MNDQSQRLESMTEYDRRHAGWLEVAPPLIEDLLHLPAAVVGARWNADHQTIELLMMGGNVPELPEPITRAEEAPSIIATTRRIQVVFYPKREL